jgi:hypothetical protein
MRNVILQEFVSLDGLAAGQNDSVDFVPASTRGDQRFGLEQLSLMDSIDTILLGRVTYRMFSDYWPNATDGDRMGSRRRVIEVLEALTASHSAHGLRPAAVSRPPLDPLRRTS